jgi:sarcosine oxidase, subunit beta
MAASGSHTADVIIIGGGIVGSSIAWHLAEAGCSSVIVLEREKHQGKGSTGKSMGGVRAQFSTELNIRMSKYSIDFYAAFDDRLQNPAGYRPQGYLFLATSPGHVDYFSRTHPLQRNLGVAVEWIATGDLAGRFPELRADDILGASFCPTDGFVDPYSVMNGFTSAAVERGVRFIKSAEVVSLTLGADGRISAVHTTAGTFSPGVVVNAAGAWSADIGHMCGLEIPVRPLKRMLVPTEPFDRFSHAAPMIIDMSNGFHFRPEGRGFLLAWADTEEHYGYNTDFEPAFVEKILERAAARVPVFENLEINPKRAWAGLYEMTPDHHPILGAADEIPGFYVATGFSGHGVMHAPSTGKITADLIIRGNTDLIDASVLSLSRFKQGKLVHEPAVL